MCTDKDLNSIFSDLHEDLKDELKRLIKVVSERFNKNWHEHVVVLRGGRKDVIDRIKQYMREKRTNNFRFQKARKIIEDIIDAEIKNDHDRFRDKVIMTVGEINENGETCPNDKNALEIAEIIVEDVVESLKEFLDYVDIDNKKIR